MRIRRLIIRIVIMCSALLISCGDRPSKLSRSVLPDEGADVSPNASSPTPADEPVDNSIFPITQIPDKCELQSSIAQLPELPAELTPRVPEMNTHLSLENWGVGYLDVSTYSPGLQWLGAAVLPLYDSPESTFWGWMACGSFVDGQTGEVRALQLPPLIQTGYEEVSLIVLEARADGWFQIEYGLTSENEIETAWVHRSHLNLSQAPLAITLWAEDYQSDIDHDYDSGSLYFRNREIAHALRSRPSETAEVVTWIGEEHMIKPLELKGEWMRVSIRQPSDYCVSPDQWNGKIHEGWIRWMSNDQGTWLYYYPRGC